MAIFVIIAALIGAVLAAIIVIGAREPSRWNARGFGPFWFVAIKQDRGAHQPVALAPGVTRRWEVFADFTFIGPQDPYWTRFMLLSGGAAGSSPIVTDPDMRDAFIAELEIGRPPVFALGILRLLVATGLLKKPASDVSADLSQKGFRNELMPDRQQIAALLAKPKSYGPAMVNFLGYYPSARYAAARDGSAPATGAKAYQRYGIVAFQTVYRAGGHLVFFGRIRQTLRAASDGPCAGRWDDIAVMQYRTPEAILSMEHVPRYLAALPHRDAGLERSVVIASSPRP